MKRIWTNGCFDILHVGHMRLLKYARSLGDTLIVGIDSDRRVQQLKGDNRPINSHDIRKEMLLSIRWVDNVIIFDCEKELENLIKKHSDKIVVGSKHSDVVFFDRVEEHSTTNILKELPYGHN